MKDQTLCMQEALLEQCSIAIGTCNVQASHDLVQKAALTAAAVVMRR